MTRRLVLEPEAEAEIAEAAEWYESRARGVGPEFLRAVEVTLCPFSATLNNIKPSSEMCVERH
jgi:hypothetical protein